MRKRAWEEGKRWLEQAQEDLKWAKDLAERGGYHIACFLAQQIGEKALKAYLYSRGEEIVLGHSIERLLAAAAEYDKEFETKAKKWAVLDAYYIPTRYPNSLPDGIPARVFNAEAAGGAVTLAEEIIVFIQKKLGKLSKQKGNIK